MQKKMMGFSWSIGVLGLVLVLVSTAAKNHSVSADEITCAQGVAALVPCRGFLSGTDPAPPAPCCSGVVSVSTGGGTTQARRDLCDCFQGAGPPFGVKLDKAQALPQLCGVTAPVPIDPSTDCATFYYIGVNGSMWSFVAATKNKA